MSHLSVRQSPITRLGPLTLSWISVAFAAIAAVWLSGASVHGALIALLATLAVAAAGHAGRVAAGRDAAAVIEWGQVGCGLLAEFAVYTGIALGSSDTPGIWGLAITAAILAALTATTYVCLRGSTGAGAGPRLFGPPGDVRLPIACAVLVLFTARAAFLVVLALGVIALVATVVDGVRQGTDRGSLRAYRGDGRIAVWIGKWVEGKVPPFPPLVVGLLVTGVLVMLGLHNLPRFLLLTPAEAMLLTAFASSHPHDGRADWLVPPLIQAAEYAYLAEIGYAGHVWPPLTFAVVAVAGLRHIDLDYRKRGKLADGIDRRGFGWEGRMIIVGFGATFGIAPVVYALLGLYLWFRVGRDWTVGWGKSTR
jgi:hypothetical protein